MSCPYIQPALMIALLILLTNGYKGIPSLIIAIMAHQFSSVTWYCPGSLQLHGPACQSFLPITNSCELAGSSEDSCSEGQCRQWVQFITLVETRQVSSVRIPTSFVKSFIYPRSYLLRATSPNSLQTSLDKVKERIRSS